jgi:hypothetical protein
MSFRDFLTFADEQSSGLDSHSQFKNPSPTGSSKAGVMDVSLINFLFSATGGGAVANDGFAQRRVADESHE